MTTQAGLTQLLAQSLQYQQAKAAEAQLRALDGAEGFPLQLLQLVSDSGVAQDVRLAGALFFKNLVRRRWTDADGNHLLHAGDVEQIKANILGLLLDVPTQPRRQLAESVVLIANSDFPARWPDLVPQLVARLDASDAVSNNAVLGVAHGVFEKWRHLDRSDELFTEIKMVLGQFTQPYLAFMQACDREIKTLTAANSPAVAAWLESMDLLMRLFFDLNCQDLPEFFEDHIAQFMAVHLEYLTYRTAAVTSDDDDETPTVVETLKAAICENVRLYAERYDEEFAPYLPGFVEQGWTLLTAAGPQPRYDTLVSRSLAFLTAVARFQRNVHMFQQEAVLLQLVERVVVPNLRPRDADLETFEDEPLDFVRRDLEGGDAEARRPAATAFLRELAAKLEAEVTRIALAYVERFLAAHAAQPANWRDKSTAVALFSAVAAKGQVTSQGVASTNPLVDVPGFFATNLASELGSSTAGGEGAAWLRVDALRFVLAFRHQLASQLLAIVPALTALLTPVQPTAVSTYAAVALERVLALRDPATNQPRFTEHDFAGHVKPMATQTLRLVTHAGGATGADVKPEALAANEFLMRLLMRILVAAGPHVAQVAPDLVPRLVQLLLAVSTNPSNPRFSHYAFEALGACLRHVRDYAAADREVVQPLFAILGNDVTEYIPYVLQILTEVLVQLPAAAPTPSSFQQLLRPLLSPQLWEARGNVPAIVGLLTAVVRRSPSLIVDGGLVTPLLGVFQQLLASPSRDAHSFELLEAILVSVPLSSLAQYLTQIAKLLLQRLAKTRTQKYGLALTRFVYTIAASPAPLGARFVVDMFNSTADGGAAAPGSSPFDTLLDRPLLDATLQIHGALARQTAAVGLTQLLCTVPALLEPADASRWTTGMTTLVTLLTHEIAQGEREAEPDVDLSELTFGSSFSPLMTTRAKPANPVAYLGVTPQEHFRTAWRGIIASPEIQRRVEAMPTQAKEYLVRAAQ